MRKDKTTQEQKLQRLRELSGIKDINESKSGTSSTVLEMTKAGKTTYAIVREGGSYFVKSTTSDVINESTLDYIGGLANKTKNKHSNYPDALKQLNLFQQDINEGRRAPYVDIAEAEVEEDAEIVEEEVVEEDEAEEEKSPEIIEEKMQKDIDPIGDQAPAAPMPSPEGMPAPDASMPPMPAPDAAPAPEAPMPQDPAADAPMPDGEAAPEMGSEEGSADEFGEEGEENQLDHFVGKLTAEIRDTPEEDLSEDKIKAILNSVIAALPLKRVSPEERIKIARRVKNAHKDGEGEQDAAAPEMGAEPEAPMPSPEGMPDGEPEAMPSMDEPEEEKLAEVELPIDKLTSKPDFSASDDEKMNGFIDKHSKSMVYESTKLKFKNVLIEAIDGNIVFNDGEFKFNVSESTLSKFKKLVSSKEKELIKESTESKVEKLIKEMLNK